MNGEELRDIKVEETEEKKPSIKDKIKSAVDTGKEKVKTGWKWCMDNKGDVLFALGVGAAAAKTVNSLKSGGKTATQREYEGRQFRVYDPHTGLYYKLRREMTNREKVELDRRSLKGETYGMILDDMGLLKRECFLK